MCLALPASGRCAAKFDPFLSLDCARAPTPSTLAQSKERKGSNFGIWQPCSRFCHVDSELCPECIYVDLTLNPERYTGYRGESATRIWNAIYEENCFR